ncbi:cytidine deaminase [candidate division KSB1 bacterium]|nr:cytidine deaminase [candidate division KSB1 bacterium]
MTIALEELLAAAAHAKSLACAPYSRFHVGAALLTSSGRVYEGCNIESSSFGLTCCAERVALFKALSDGEKKFELIVVRADTEEFCSPCGACRQVLWDYARDLKIVLANAQGATRTLTLKELLPEAFDDRLLTREH